MGTNKNLPPQFMWKFRCLYYVALLFGGDRYLRETTILSCKTQEYFAIKFKYMAIMTNEEQIVFSFSKIIKFNITM